MYTFCSNFTVWSLLRRGQRLTLDKRCQETHHHHLQHPSAKCNHTAVHIAAYLLRPDGNGLQVLTVLLALALLHFELVRPRQCLDDPVVGDGKVWLNEALGKRRRNITAYKR